ncbi:MAG: hypothetical protein JWN48_4233 [Myxococcaceae bacterium]|nr:hypothetical protein [Myxococcaceae bacterium]
MMEAVWALAIVLILGALAAVGLFSWFDLIEAGQVFMLRSAALGIPLELLYFALLALAIGRRADCPKGWYWRSFMHHHLLSRSQRWWVLPWFYLGALAFLGIVLGIGLVMLGLLAALQQR